MKEDLQRALDEGLEAIARGEPLEECLARYPHLAEELRPLLEMAWRLHLLGRQLPPPESRVRGWLTYARRASQMRRQATSPVTRLLPLVLASSLMVVLGIGLAVTAVASARSLPNSPLYRVKLVAEEARLFITWGDEAKANLLLGQAESRMREIETLIGQGEQVPGIALAALRSRVGRAASILAHREGPAAQRALRLGQDSQSLLLRLGIHLSPTAQKELIATIASVHNARLRLLGRGATVQPGELVLGVFFLEGVGQRTDDPRIWQIGELAVLVDDGTIVEDGLGQGVLVRALVGLGPDGRARALLLTPLSLQGIELVLQGVVEDLEEGEVVIEGQKVLVPVGSLPPRLKIGDRVEVRAQHRDGALVASEVRVLTPVDMAATLVIEGTAEQDLVVALGEATAWRAAGRGFRVLSTTVILAEGGPVKKGTRVRVVARAIDDELIAERIVVLAPSSPSPNLVAVQGVFQPGGDGKWIVGGVAVEPPKNAPTPEPGSVLRVELLQEGGQTKATDAVVISGPNNTGMTNVRGPIISIDKEAWQVNGITVRITGQTRIKGDPKVGKEVDVWGDLQADGSIAASFIEVLEPAPAQPSPTPAAPATSTPQADSSATPVTSGRGTPSPTPHPSPTPVP